ncbi:membrane associated rhomboid family serine protease [Frondihabitans sp. PhB188]|uniref:rhomboid family intramembrane serine protease n=1 Tax=Frondihabitans sp. PhB188 TaxID=2485200 RepID=UPI000FAE7831|nr:rhomboid family intramembrane serine protease [Frondihabitans sp. PhB188]ROQ37100.1 membrane associated rhomboid family serine protease [Frondihabitans sp. PhB188]
MTNVPRNADNFCYRHPDRQSFILCQRCGRTICTQCQTPAAVGVHCPECVREQRGSMPRVKPRVVTRMNGLASSGGPVVTYGLMALAGVGFLIGLVPGGFNLLGFNGALALSQPWRIVTGIFVYSGIFAIIQLAFNVYMLWAFGSMIERELGRARFIALYVLGALGGELASSIFIPGYIVPIVGSAMFGLFGAFYVILRSRGQQANQILVLIALNIVIGLVLGSPWQMYIGAAAIGALSALIFTRTQHRSQLNAQRGLTIGLGVALIVIILLRSATLTGAIG